MKLSSFSTLAMGALLLASCSGNKKDKTPGENLFDPIDYTLTVNNITDTTTAFAYLYDYDAMTGGKLSPEALIDSAAIENGQAVFDIKGSTTPVAILIVSDRSLYIPVFPKAGENSYDLANLLGSSEEGKSYNDFSAKVREIYTSASENMPQRGTPEYTAYNDSVDNLLSSLREQTMTDNIFNALGYYLATQTAESNLESTDSIIAKAPYLADTKRMRSVLKELAKLKATSAGQPYKDFTIETGGKSVKLSDYVKPGAYTLVDFWASWCGPCKRAIASLKENYDELHAKGLNVVGVAVWEDQENTEKWLKDNPLPWDLILGAQHVPTDLYAVKGIPTLVLIGPDGKIVARSYSDEEILEAFNAAIK